MLLTLTSTFIPSCPNTVTIVRAIIGMSGRLEVLTNIESAQFFTDILRTFSRVPRYLNVLCEESVLPVLLNTMNEFFHPQVINTLLHHTVSLHTLIPHVTSSLLTHTQKDHHEYGRKFCQSIHEQKKPTRNRRQWHRHVSRQDLRLR